MKVKDTDTNDASSDDYKYSIISILFSIDEYTQEGITEKNKTAINSFFNELNLNNSVDES
jgi:hypothetical protein